MTHIGISLWLRDDLDLSVERLQNYHAGELCHKVLRFRVAFFELNLMAATPTKSKERTE